MNDLEKTVIEVDQRSKSNTYQINEIKDDIRKLAEENKAIYEIASSVKIIASNMENIEEKIDQTGKKVDAVNSKVNDVERKIIDVENKPARETAETISKIKIAAYTSIVTFLVSGILGSVIFFAMR